MAGTDPCQSNMGCPDWHRKRGKPPEQEENFRVPPARVLLRITQQHYVYE